MVKEITPAEITASLVAAFSPNTTTENGATARSTTGSDILNLFSQIGGLRATPEASVPMVLKALREDPDLTAKCVFYSRDPRGGQGEREIFRQNIRALVVADSRFKKLIPHIPYFGRWDDMFCLIDVAKEEVMAEIHKQLDSDLGCKNPSLLAKWLPSENASSAKTVALARVIRNELKLNSKDYRQMLSALRKQIAVVETLMSSGQWDQIEFKSVPSNAMLLYRKAFGRRDPMRFSQYMEDVKSGKTKINAGVLFPYDLVGKYLHYLPSSADEMSDAVIDAQWKALPDYFNGVTENSMVVADVSGSMSGLPMAVSISLAMYVAERNKGPWHNRFLTFSEEPYMDTVRGNSLREKVQNLSQAKWNMNTNIEKVFDTILRVAVNTSVKPADMVKRIYIVSDMEFDVATSKREYTWNGDRSHSKVDETLFQTIRGRYTAAGYDLPELIFWNVSARNTQFPMAMDERGFLNVSGCSPSIFKHTLGKKFASAYDLMLEVLQSPKYECIKVT